VPSDSRLIVSYVAGYDTELLESRAENDLLELRFSGKQPPCVQIETPLIQTLSGKIIRCKARY
jgi:hypothetical protein